MRIPAKHGASIFRNWLTASTMLGIFVTSTCAHAEPQITEIPIEDAIMANLAPASGTEASPADEAAETEKADVPAKAESYRVGPGDVIQIALSILPSRLDGSSSGTISVWDSTQTGQKVDQQGLVSLPVLGVLDVGGKTVEEINAYVLKKMNHLYRNPSVVTNVLEYNSQKAVISGEVQKPMNIPITGTPITVSHAIELAGGLKDTADLKSAAILHSDGTHTSVDLSDIMMKGNLAQNHVLQDGDSLLVPGNHLNKVFVFGEFISPQTQTIRQDRYTLAEALSSALGPNPVTYSDYLYVIRGGASDAAVHAASGENPRLAYTDTVKNLTVYTLNLSNPTSYALADQFELQARDVVYLSPSMITRWSRFINQLLPGGITSAVSAGTNVKAVSN